MNTRFCSMSSHKKSLFRRMSLYRSLTQKHPDEAAGPAMLFAMKPDNGPVRNEDVEDDKCGTYK